MGRDLTRRAQSGTPPRRSRPHPVRVGSGAEMDVNTGPWELIFQDASTNKATMDAYNRRPDS